MCNGTDSYICNLPEEILTKILSYLRTYDVMQFCKSYPSISYVLYDSKVMRSVDFSKEFRLDVYDFRAFVEGGRGLCKIKHLNINNVYWISLKDLHNCIGKLSVLQSLFAMDTKLGLTETDCTLYKQCPNLETLALTMTCQDSEYLNFLCNVSNLKFIYLHISDSNYSRFEINYYRRIFENNNLQRVWIFDEYLFFPKVFYLINPWNSEKQPFRSFINLSKTGDIRIILLETNTVWKYFLEEFNGPERVRWTEENTRLMQFIPFGINDVKSLCDRKCNLETIDFEELNFCHASSVCIKRFHKFVHDVLISVNAKRLKKLAINSCVCEREIGVDIMKNCLLLEELEIMNCEGMGVSQKLKNIGNLKNLKKLSLMDIPFCLQDTCLVEIVRSCAQLEFLSIRPTSLLETFQLTTSEDEKIFYENLYTALTYATSLKDLRLELYKISLYRLFQSLNQLHDSQIQRMFIKCAVVEDFNIESTEEFQEKNVAPIKLFLQKNPNLVFFLMTITNIINKYQKSIQDLMNAYRSGPQKVFYVTTDETKFTGCLPIPAIHKTELMVYTTKVSVLDYFKKCDI